MKPRAKTPVEPVGDSADPGEPRRSVGGLALWLALLLLVAYPLSVGPAAWVAEKNWVPEPVLEVVYAPLVWVARHSRPAERFFDWYVGLFWSPPPK